MFRLLASLSAAVLLTACPEVTEDTPESPEMVREVEARTVSTADTLPVLGEGADEVQDTCTAWAAPGAHVLVVPGFEDRPALMYVPDVDGPRDAVVMLHGAQHTGAITRNITQLHVEADARGMVAVFPNGVDRVWRAGFARRDIDESTVDDVAYLSALSDALAEQVCVDRIVAAGFSNGSMMAQRWACEGTGVDAVVASGGARMHHACENDATPILLAHGTADARIPFDGSPNEEGTVWPSVKETTQAWVDHNGWNGEQPSESGNGPIQCLTFDGDAPVIRCLLGGWGHAWPGGLNVPANASYDLSAVALDWFQALQG